MNKTIFLTGVVFGLLAVVLGAFGAHGLEKLVDSNAIGTFETGVRYQMYHAFFLMILGSNKRLPEAGKKWIYYFIVLGIFFFSFSIYFLATNSLFAFDFKTIGFITPLGGLFFICGWSLLGYRSLKHFD